MPVVWQQKLPPLGHILRHKPRSGFQQDKRGKQEGSLSSSVDCCSERRNSSYGNMFDLLILLVRRWCSSD